MTMLLFNMLQILKQFKDGFERIGAKPCSDINECESTDIFTIVDDTGSEVTDVVSFDRGHNDANKCHTYATCYNLPGAYECRCQDGYVGDGYHCEVKNFCAIRQFFKSFKTLYRSDHIYILREYILPYFGCWAVLISRN